MESMWSPHAWIGEPHQPPDPRQLRFESQRVRMLLGALGLADQVPALIQQYGPGQKICHTDLP